MNTYKGASSAPDDNPRDTDNPDLDAAERDAFARVEALAQGARPGVAKAADSAPPPPPPDLPAGITVHVGDDAVRVAKRVREKVTREKRAEQAADRRAPGVRGRRAEDLEPDTAADGDPVFACTDLGNAERLARQHGTDLRWCEAWGAWLVWDGARWTRDDTGEVIRRAASTVRQIGAEAAACADERERRALLSHALKSESARALAGMVTLARAQPGMAVRVEDLDGDPWAFNCRNGVVDLRTGELRPHRREDMHTKASPVDYDPAARSDTWEKFLRENLDGDTPNGAAVVEYLRRAVGYSLTGDVREEVLFFLHGAGGSGKSTFIEAVRAVLGDYAMVAKFDTFLARTGDAPSTSGDIARLRGARYVSAIETNDGKRLDAGKVKELTGGDVVTAREVYERASSFRPQFKLWLVANDAPKVNDRDDALFRRMRRVTFPHGRTDDDGSRDTSIKAELVNAEVSGAAILAWAVQGCLAWQRDGLKTPDAVRASTAAYRCENDPLAEFFAARVVFDRHSVVARKVLRDAYEAWCRNDGTGAPMTPKRFGERLRARLAAEHGAEHKADTSARLGASVVDGWRGVRLVAPHATPHQREPGDESEHTGRVDHWTA